MVGYDDRFGENRNVTKREAVSEVIEENGIAVGETVDSEFDKEGVNVIRCDDPFEQLSFERCCIREGPTGDYSRREIMKWEGPGPEERIKLPLGRMHRECSGSPPHSEQMWEEG